MAEEWNDLNPAPAEEEENVSKDSEAESGKMTDVKISYTESYIDQMLRYGRDYSPLTR